MPNKQIKSLLVSKAFTIIELVIVVSVLVILIGIAVPHIKGMLDNSNVAKANKEVQSIEAALESYYTYNNNQYPPSSTSVTTTYLVGQTPQIISTTLYDPFAPAGTEYNYLASSNGQYYVVWSAGLTGASQPTAISSTGAISY